MSKYKMIVKLISDIHLEFLPWKGLDTGDILVIAGDLGTSHTLDIRSSSKKLPGNISMWF